MNLLFFFFFLASWLWFDGVILEVFYAFWNLGWTNGGVVRYFRNPQKISSYVIGLEEWQNKSCNFKKLRRTDLAHNGLKSLYSLKMQPLQRPSLPLKNYIFVIFLLFLSSVVIFLKQKHKNILFRNGKEMPS